MKFFQKLWHKNGIKKLPRAFFECAGYVRVLNKLVCGKMCGFSENRPKSGGFDEKNSGNTAAKCLHACTNKKLLQFVPFSWQDNGLSD